MSQPYNILDITPQIEIKNNKSLLQYKKGKEWLKVSYEFIAKSEANYIIIGNFINDQDMRMQPKKGEIQEYHDYYYFVDNIELIPLNTTHDTSIILKTKVKYIIKTTDIL